MVTHYGITLVSENNKTQYTNRNQTKEKSSKPSSLGSISEEGNDGEELSTNALTPQQQQRLALQSIGQSLSVNNRGAGKRKRKTRKRKRRRTKKKRRRNKRKTKKRRKSRRRR